MARKTGKMVPTLVFSIYAWQKLMWLTNHTDLEFGCWGLTDPKDPLYVMDVLLCPQDVNATHCEFRDAGVADLMDTIIEKGYQPRDVFRVWIHSHPTFGTTPSQTDWNTVDKLFGTSDYGIMVIVNQNQNCTAVLRQNGPIQSEMDITVGIDWKEGSSITLTPDDWKKEYDINVFKAPVATNTLWSGKSRGQDWYNRYGDLYSEEYREALPPVKSAIVTTANGELPDEESDLGLVGDDFAQLEVDLSRDAQEGSYLYMYSMLERLYRDGLISLQDLTVYDDYILNKAEYPENVKRMLEELNYV